MSSRKRIAIISIWFSPKNAVAVNRIKAFDKYLSADHEVIVYTHGEKDEQKENVHYFTSESLLSKLKHSGNESKLLHHLKSLGNKLVNLLGLSQYSKWRKKTCLALLKDHQSTPFDIVISSFSPFEAHDVALELKKKDKSVKWIADMRDEMSGNPFLSQKESDILLKREREYIDYVDAITTVSFPILESFQKIFSKTLFFKEIRNGYDHTVSPIESRNEKLTFLYAGTFYGKRKPDYFFNALQEIPKNILEDIRVNLIGVNTNIVVPKNISNQIHLLGQVPYVESVKMMAESDVNLLINPPKGTKGQFSGKIFDYLSIEKPVFGMIDTEDVAADLINDLNGGIVVEFFDLENIKKAILTFHKRWKQGCVWEFNTLEVKKLHRKYQVEKLNELIKEISL